MAHEKWSKEELRASVLAYLDMLEMERRGERFVKIEVIRKLQATSLKDRTKGSVEKRFQNISSVLENQGKKWLTGYKPLSHVGKNVWNDIIDILNEV